MHIPDGFLSTPVWIGLSAVSAPSVSIAVRKAQQGLEETRAPLLGVMGAFVFAAQMINFPVGVGTSGHLIGGALLAMTLGPAAATVVMTAILGVQALVFQDGGLLALGANVFNMGVAGVAAGYLPYALWGGGRGRSFAVFLGGALSTLVAALLTLGELLISGVRMPGPILGVSLGLFAISAVMEGVITLAALRGIEAMNPAWIRTPGADNRRAVWVLASAALMIAVFGALYASSLPDGLEALAEKAGFADHAKTLWETPLGDYEAQWLRSEWPRKATAGLAGIAAIFAIGALLGRVFARRRRA